jgi:hypothetical protein
MGDSSDPAQVEGLLSKMTEAGRDGPAFGAIGLRRGRLHLVTVADRAGVDSRLARDHADAWRRLDVSVLHQALFPSLGNLSKPEEIEFTEDAHNAAAEVASGRWDVALLLNPTPVSRVLECADAGERMPQKSTYFYPKLATGVLMYPVDKD